MEKWKKNSIASWTSYASQMTVSFCVDQESSFPKRYKTELSRRHMRATKAERKQKRSSEPKSGLPEWTTWSTASSTDVPPVNSTQSVHSAQPLQPSELPEKPGRCSQQTFGAHYQTVMSFWSCKTIITLCGGLRSKNDGK